MDELKTLVEIIKVGDTIKSNTKDEVLMVTNHNDRNELVSYDRKGRKRSLMNASAYYQPIPPEDRIMTIPAKVWCDAIETQRDLRHQLKQMKILYTLSQARGEELKQEVTRLTRWGDVGYNKAQTYKEECERLLREWD